MKINKYLNRIVSIGFIIITLMVVPIIIKGNSNDLLAQIVISIVISYGGLIVSIAFWHMSNNPTFKE